MTPKTLFLLDAYALIYRAHFAFTKNPRINSKGINTSVVFGFTNTLVEVIQKQKPSHIAVAFDTPAETFRDQLFADYKATRQETPENIRTSVPIIKEIIRGFGIPILEVDGYEADDIIGTISKRAEQENFTVYMMTPDKDFGQLVSEQIFLYKPAYMGSVVDILGPKEVCEKWAIETVSQVIDMLGLQGDTADNIPGIPGVGPKTAADLIQQYHSLENIIAHASELKGKLKERVEQFGEQAILSKKLATIILDVPIEWDEKELAYSGPIVEKLQPLFELLEFKTLATRLFSKSSATASIPNTTESAQLSMFRSSLNEDAGVAIPNKKSIDTTAVKYLCIQEPDIPELIKKIKTVKTFSFDLVTDNIDPLNTRIVKLMICPCAGECYEVPFSQLLLFKELFEDDQITKIGYQSKYAILSLKKWGVQLCGPLFDILLAHYLIEPESSHDLDILCNQYLNYHLSTTSLDTLPFERPDLYLQLKPLLQKDLETRGHSRLLRDVEMPLVFVLADMEFEGVSVDEVALKQLSKTLQSDSEKVQSEIYQIAGEEFNINSPKQLGEVLFDKMKLASNANGDAGKIKKTKTGQYATGEEVLLKLAPQYPIARKIVDYREFEKLRSTYVDALPKMVNPLDGRIHTDYRQAVAATGRLSSNNPNLQNIPIRTERGKQIRSAFIPRDTNYLLLSADYSQIELRIAASFAQDETMIEAFRNGRDIHTTTAAKIFKVSPDQVTPDMRRKAKEVNFGILYGSTAFGLAQNLQISRNEAAAIIDSYFKEFSAIKRYMDHCINQAREKEYVETILGRRRYLRDINSRNITTRGFAERNAINAPIQGSAADIIKIAMINIHRWLKKEKMQTKMIMQVHDELVFDLHLTEQEVVISKVKTFMKTAVTLEVPMEVEVGVGANWLEAH